MKSVFLTAALLTLTQTCALAGIYNSQAEPTAVKVDPVTIKVENVRSASIYPFATDVELVRGSTENEFGDIIDNTYIWRVHPYVNYEVHFTYFTDEGDGASVGETLNGDAYFLWSERDSFIWAHFNRFYWEEELKRSIREWDFEGDFFVMHEAMVSSNAMLRSGTISPITPVLLLDTNCWEGLSAGSVFNTIYNEAYMQTPAREDSWYWQQHGG